MLQAIGNHVIVKRDKPDEKGRAIIIPDAYRERGDTGVVLSVGQGKRNERGELIPIEAKVGERVFFQKYNGTDIDIDGESLHFLDARDVFAVVQ